MESHKDPDIFFCELQSYIDSISDRQYADIARYEMAKACEILKGDFNSSREILNRIIEDSPGSDMALISEKRLRYMEAAENYSEWEKLLESSYSRANERYASYFDTSWLAFPLKLFKWFRYFQKNITASANQVKAKQFRLQYDAMRSPFSEPVDMVFDKFKPFSGNKETISEVVLLYNNSDSWYARWKIITEAKHSINMKYYIIKPDIFGYSTLGALMMKAREGLKIKILLDARGSWRLISRIFGSAIIRSLDKYPNVEIKVYRPLNRSLLTAFIDFREIMASNHKKLILVDGKYSIIGGRNIASEYFASQEDHSEAWYDCDILINSSGIALQLEYMFDEQFMNTKSVGLSGKIFGSYEIAEAKLTAAYNTMESHLQNEKFHPYTDPVVSVNYIDSARKFLKELELYPSLRNYRGFKPFPSSYKVPVKILDSVSLGDYRNDITDELIKYIDGSKELIIIQNAYIVLTRRMFNALKRAGRRGVSIILHTNSPKSSDNIFSQAMFYADWKRFLADIPNLAIYVHGGKDSMHAKNWVFDGIVSIVGTYNLDYLGEQVNSEIVVAVKSREFAGLMKQEIMSQIAGSKKYISEEDEDGELLSIYGPDNLPGNYFWLLRTISKLKGIRHLI